MSIRVTPKTPDVMAAATRMAEADLDRFMDRFADETRHLSPYDTGHNSRSIASSRTGLEAEIHTESGYGGWLEVGTSRQTAQPYFRPAFERVRSEFSR